MNYSKQPYNDNLPNQPWSNRCTCGKCFMQPNSYALHIGCCAHFKARLGKGLKLARERRTQAPSEKTGDSPQTSGKRKFSWIDDNNLDVDYVPTPKKIVTDLPTETKEPLSDSPDLPSGRGLRPKKVSYKVQPTSNFQPSSTLPISLFPVLPLPAAVPDTTSVASPTSEEPLDTPAPPELVTVSTDPQIRQKAVKAVPNAFGLYKVIHESSSKDVPHDLDASIAPCDLRVLEKEPSPRTRPSQDKLYPFPNLNVFRLGEWYWSDDNGKGTRSFEQLLDIVSNDDFNPADIRAANWRMINNTLASSEHDTTCSGHEGWIDDGSSWISSPVTVQVPLSEKAGPGPHSFTVNGFHHRPLTPIIREKLESSSSLEYFNTLPYDLRWKPGAGKADSRVYGEMYHSPAFLKAHNDLQNSPPEKNCKHPRYIVRLMFASDVTMLASFGTAKLWPLYMSYTNNSKCFRAKPSEKLFETVAYFEKLPDEFKDFILNCSGNRTVPQPLLTHCQRELFHEQWKVILDAEFLEAYCHGIVVTCYDGEPHRFYPRIFTYSADYPEKILLASIKILVDTPAPGARSPWSLFTAWVRNEIAIIVYALCEPTTASGKRESPKPESSFMKASGPSHLMLSRRTSHRGRWFQLTYVVHHRSLSPLTPALQNAFSQGLLSHGFDLFPMLVVDLMHEVELGVWKVLFIQLLCILEVHDKGSTHKLDERYRSVPTFGKDVICCFTNNASDMKQLAARDFEDLLQCAIPAFEGLLLSTHNKQLVDLLFTFSSWHSLAKLWLHTDHTLNILDMFTTALGDKLWRFAKLTCTKFETHELPREYQSRKRREARRKRAALKPGNGAKPGSDDPAKVGESAGDGRKKKTLNLNTYKFHALGDVATTICSFGTTDSYSTQSPEGYHRFHKRHYKRTSKKDVSRQLSRIQMWQARICKLWKQLLPEPDEAYVDDDAFELPYFIGKSQNNPIGLPALVQTKRDDPAMKGFILNLKSHLLPRIYLTLLQEAKDSGDGPTSRPERVQLLQSLAGVADVSKSPAEVTADMDQIYFHSECLYQHNVLNINYTSYDVRRHTDIINAKTPRRDVMCIRSLDKDEPPASAHCYVYARVLGVYHTNVVYKGCGATDLCKRRFDFLFVRWFEFCRQETESGTLDHLRLVLLAKPNTVGFLDPGHLLRACHIIPCYSLSQLYRGDSRRIESKIAQDGDDWEEYYVNRFVDRDMFMRYAWGLGVGHIYSHLDAPAASTHAFPGDEGIPGDTLTSGVELGEDHQEEGMFAEPSIPVDQEDTLENLEDEELDVDAGSESDQSDMSEEKEPGNDSETDKE